MLDIEFLNLNAHRRYPLAEDTSVELSGSTRNLPESLIVDFVFSVDQSMAANGAVLTNIVYAGSMLSLVWKNSAGVLIGSVTIDMTAHTENKAYTVMGEGTYEGAAGKVTIGDPTQIAADMPQGAFTLQAHMEASTVIPALRGVNSLIAAEDGSDLEPLYGHVRLLPGTNIRLTHLPEINAIRIDAIDGEGLNEDCDCENDLERPCIQTINGVNASDVRIVGDDCLEITASGGKLTIENPCASPCCGCEELIALTQALKQLETNYHNLGQLANMLQTAFTQYQQAVIQQYAMKSCEDGGA